MLRRDVVRIVGSVLALPFLPRNAEAAIELAETAHQRVRDGGNADFRTLTPSQRALVSEIADAIIPRTDTPGALDVQVPEFIDFLLTEWAKDEERERFLEGLEDIDSRAVARGAPSFVALQPEQKTALLSELDKARHEDKGAGLAFGRIKSLTVYGYFTSDRVRRDVLKHQMYFARYEGNAPHTPQATTH